jgi:microcystin-dependent protein
MAVYNPPLHLTGDGAPAAPMRRFHTTLFGGSQGVMQPGHFAVSQRPSPGMGVEVAAGSALVNGTESSSQGAYFVEALTDTDLTIDTADASNPRIDLVVARVRDSDFSGAVDSFALEVVKGTAAATPAVPATPANSLVLAEVLVGAGATSITNSAITDRRAHYGQVAGLIPALTIPAGTVQTFAGASAPSGWLLCDGAAVSRVTYKTLFDVIGTTYGAGNGSTTFNLPNMLGRVPVGRDTGQTEFDALGKTGGAKTHTLTESQIPGHTHTGPSHTHAAGTLATSSAGAHTHTIPQVGTTDNTHNHANNGTTAQGSDPGTVATSGVTASSGAHTHTMSGSTAASGTGNTGSTGGGSAHNNLQPYLALNYIIKV